MQQNLNLEAIRLVAYGLKELKEKVVFVGGAVLGLYIDHPNSDPVRFTKDIDLTIELANLSAWATLQVRLAELGFFPKSDDSVICRYLFNGVIVDLMPTIDSPFGPTNIWYAPGFQQAIYKEIEPGLSIKMLTLPYFIATKFVAFHGRGGDPRMSHDFEDIIFLCLNCSNIVSAIQETDTPVKSFLILEFQKIWSDQYREEIICCHLQPERIAHQIKVISKNIIDIINLK
ncbi:MAG: hypothetical protein ACOYPR_20230 [Saprospiraceae bacterium]